MTESSKPAPAEPTSPLLAATAQMADAIRVYYEGLGALPEPLKEQLTREFAAEINKAMTVRIAKGSERSGA